VKDLANYNYAARGGGPAQPSVDINITSQGVIASPQVGAGTGSFLHNLHILSQHGVTKLTMRTPQRNFEPAQSRHIGCRRLNEAINKEEMVAVGKVVFTSREHIIALEARGKGLVGITLRYPMRCGKSKSILMTSLPQRSPRICWN
jgi:hypothetical protein